MEQRYPEIGAKAYFGANSVACTGARIDERCSVKRSILLPNVRLREGAELRGAILCENVQVGRDSVIYEGAVMGAGSDIGARSIVGEGVKLWPYKRLEAEGEYRENIIWRGNALCSNTPLWPEWHLRALMYGMRVYARARH